MRKERTHRAIARVSLLPQGDENCVSVTPSRETQMIDPGVELGELIVDEDMRKHGFRKMNTILTLAVITVPLIRPVANYACPESRY